jgi:uncharacterized protein (DUF1697 family)
VSQTYIALLRAVNLGSHGKVAMADLRALLAALNLRDGKTLLQSGNLIFRADTRAPAALEPRLEAETAQRLGLSTDFFVRGAAEWRALVAANPFPEQARRDPSHLVAMFLKAPASADRIEALQEAVSGREIIRGGTRHRIGRSRLTNLLIEKKLGTRATGRNWNTVLKLQALADPHEGS